MATVKNLNNRFRAACPLPIPLATSLSIYTSGAVLLVAPACYRVSPRYQSSCKTNPTSRFIYRSGSFRSLLFINLITIASVGKKVA